MERLMALQCSCEDSNSVSRQEIGCVRVLRNRTVSVASIAHTVGSKLELEMLACDEIYTM